MKSTHKAEVVKISKIVPHPNADKMKIAKIFGWDVCIGLNQFKEGGLAVFIQPDSIVPDDPKYYFLKQPTDGVDFPKRRRLIRVKRLRGVYSQGLLMEIPEGIVAKEGDDLAEVMRIEHYEPEENTYSGSGKIQSGDTEKAPEGIYPHYDVDNIKRYGFAFEDGEEIVATEKIHGCNTCVVFSHGRFYVRSRTQWKRPTIADLEYFAESWIDKVKVKFYKTLKKMKFFKMLQKLRIPIGDKSADWWVALKDTVGVQKLLKDNPGMVIFGEIYGKVQNLHYGVPNVKFIAFDIMKDGQFIDWDESQSYKDKYQFDWVPLAYRGPYDIDLLNELAEGDSIMPHSESGHIREGLVIKPVKERYHDRMGRVQAKLVSNRYLER